MRSSGTRSRETALRNTEAVGPTGLPIMRSDDPYTAVVYGAGKALDDLDLLKQVSFE